MAVTRSAVAGDQDLLVTHPGQTIVGDKGYVSKDLDAESWPASDSASSPGLRLSGTTGAREFAARR
ncbi:hypothetical protein AB0L24_23955 [Streptomyces achromogenes]